MNVSHLIIFQFKVKQDANEQSLLKGEELTWEVSEIISFSNHLLPQDLSIHVVDSFRHSLLKISKKYRIAFALSFLHVVKSTDLFDYLKIKEKSKTFQRKIKRTPKIFKIKTLASSFLIHFLSFCSAFSHNFVHFLHVFTFFSCLHGDRR